MEKQPDYATHRWHRATSMIFSLRRALRTLSTGIALLALTGAAQPVWAGPAENDQEWDVEIRCCFVAKDMGPGQELEAVFQILLLGSDHPIGHLKLTTPKGVILGFDEKTKRFARPKPEGVYGLLSEGRSMLDPTWFNNTPRFLVLFPEKGEYTLQVIGERDGKYALFIHPMGRERIAYVAPPMNVEDGVVSFPISGPIPIKAGKIHTYVFPGEFDANVHSPNRFYLKRVK